MTRLFDSYQLGALSLPNRLVMAPMTRPVARPMVCPARRRRPTTPSEPRPGGGRAGIRLSPGGTVCDTIEQDVPELRLSDKETWYTPGDAKIHRLP
jgi:hypothetical protein